MFSPTIGMHTCILFIFLHIASRNVHLYCLHILLISSNALPRVCTSQPAQHQWDVRISLLRAAIHNCGSRPGHYSSVKRMPFKIYCVRTTFWDQNESSSGEQGGGIGGLYGLTLSSQATECCYYTTSYAGTQAHMHVLMRSMNALGRMSMAGEVLSCTQHTTHTIW